MRLATNSEANIQARREYAEFMLQLGQNVRTVFPDETGFNLWLRRSQGRSFRGRPVKRTVTTQRGPNVTVCMAISADFGLVSYTVQRGGQTGARFQDFLSQLAERCFELDQESEWLILMDGPNFHRAARVPDQLQHRVSIRILPPYSPFLNAAELANSALKSAIKMQLAEPETVEEEAAPPEGITMEDWRFMILERLARQVIPDVITSGKAAAWELSCSRLFGRCLNQQF